MALLQRCAELSQQLGYKEGTPVNEVISQAEKELGLDGSGLDLVQRCNNCCAALGITGSSSTEQPPIAPVAATMAAAVPMGTVVQGTVVMEMMPQPAVMPEPRHAPVPQFGGEWELYMVNGPLQHKEQLRSGMNVGGYGDVASNPPSGGHKMAEPTFNAKRFDEVLVVGSDGSWGHIRRLDGGAIPASDAFRVGAAEGYSLRFSNGHAQNSPGNDPWGAGGNHGPFFVDVWHRGRVEAGQWMWCDAEFDPRRPRMGKVLGTRGACFADEQGGFVWKWYGRSGHAQAALPPMAAALDAAAPASLDAWVGQRGESFPNGQPSSIVETFQFTREGDVYVTTGSGSGRNTYTRRGETLVHTQHGEVTATLQPNGELAWSHGYGSRVIAPGAPPAAPAPGAGLIQTKDIEGHAGCLISPLLCPFEEHRQRVPGTNGFHKVGEPGNVDQYSSPSCHCNGPACSMRLC